MAILLASWSLAACGPSTPRASPELTGPTRAVTVPVDLPVTIALAGRFAGQTLAVLDEQIADFEAANPDVRIEVVRAPRDTLERRKWVASRLEEPDNDIDIFVLDATWPAEFAANGDLVSLDDRVTSAGIDPDSFLPATIRANTFDGQLVALPWTADGGLLYYRRDLLDRYGYDPPATWTELQRQALEIKAQEELPFGFVWAGAAAENLTCNTLEYVSSHGGDLLDAAGNAAFDSIQSRAALQKMSDLVTSGASPRDTAMYDMSKAISAFRNGEAAFLRAWFDAQDYLTRDDSQVSGLVGLAPLPASCLGGQSLGLSAYSRNPDKAARFMAYLTGHHQQRQLALAANQLPALEAIYHDAALITRVPALDTVRTVLSAARTRPSLADYSLLSEAIYGEVNRMLAGEQDVETTALEIQRRISSAFP